MGDVIRELFVALGFKVDENSKSKTEDSIKGIKNMANKLLGAVGVTLSIKGLAELAEAAAEVEALNSQFTQVFGKMEKQATEKLNKIAEATGVTVNRLKGSYVQIAAFAKTSGMNQKEALGLSERAMTAVADSAAFYDRSIEDVTASMQSFLKGNYANDAALGISCTETTRNAVANKLYSKSFKDLSESQKQLTLLQMVEDANKLSGAEGQAAREADTWTNQLGNLKQHLKDLKAEVGSTFLSVAVDVLKKLSLLTEKLIEGVKKLRNYCDTHLGGIEHVLKLVAVAAGLIWAALKVGKIKEILNGALTAVKALTGAQGILNAKMLVTIGIIILLVLIVQDFIYFMQGKDSLFGDLLAQAGVDIDKLRKDIVNAWENIKTALKSIWEGIKNGVSETFNWIWNIVKPILEALGVKVGEAGVSFADFMDKLANGEVDTEQFEKIGEIIGKIAGIAAVAIPAIVGIIGVVKLLKGAFSLVSGAITFLTSPVGLVIASILLVIGLVILIAKHWDEIKAAVEEVWQTITELFSEAGAFFSDVWQSIVQTFTDVWNTIVENFNDLMSTIQELFSDAWSAISGVLTTIGAFFYDYVIAPIVEFATSLWATLVEIWNSIVQTFSAAWTAIQAVFSTAGQWFYDNIVAPVINFATNLLTSIVSIAGNIRTAIVNALNSAISFIKSLPSQALQWGRDIIQGIANGIRSAIGKVTDAASAVASKIRSFLHFSEPDEGPLSDFHTYMPDMIQMMSEGIIKGKEKLNNAVGKLAGGLKSRIEGNVKVDYDKTDVEFDDKDKDKPKTPPPPPPQPRDNILGQMIAFAKDMALSAKVTAVYPDTVSRAEGRSNINNRSVKQTVNISNTFNGDRAGQQKSSEAMDKATDDTIGNLSRALATV